MHLINRIIILADLPLVSEVRFKRKIEPLLCILLNITETYFVPVHIVIAYDEQLTL